VVVERLNLLDILLDKTDIPISRQCFEDYLKAQESVGNLKFWMAVEELKKNV